MDCGWAGPTHALTAPPSGIENLSFSHGVHSKEGIAAREGLWQVSPRVGENFRLLIGVWGTSFGKLCGYLANDSPGIV